MKKFKTCFLGLIGLNSLGFAILPLNEMASKALFNHKTWTAQKDNIKQLLIQRKIPANIFKGKTIIGLDFSNLDLTGKDFSDCRFFKVNFKGANLTNTIFDNTRFDQCDLIGAFFLYSTDPSKNAVFNKGFRISTTSLSDLVKQYSDFMNKKQEMEDLGFQELAIDLSKKAECINHLFKTLRLNLSINEKLNRNAIDWRNFNLTDMNFENIVLDNIKLEGVRLSKDFEVPHYKNTTELYNLFKEAVNKNTSNKQHYRTLINSHVNILPNFVHTNLKDLHWKNLEFIRNINLSPSNDTIKKECDLSKTDFEGVKFIETDLSHTNLTNANLIKTKFTNCILHQVKLNGARFSKNFQLLYNHPSQIVQKWYIANKNDAPEKKYYNMLLANKFDMLTSISKEQLIEIIKKSAEEKLDLRGAYLLNSNLNDIQLSKVNLKNVDLQGSQLQKSTLTEINLKNSNLRSNVFTETICKKVDFDLSNLEYAKFNQAILNTVSFKGANLFGANFTDATLENVDFFAADIGNIQLAKNVILPNKDKDNDQEYIKCYYDCKDLKAKSLLKIILESRGHSL